MSVSSFEVRQHDIAQRVPPGGVLPMVAAAMVLHLLLIWVFWVGFLGSDDSLYRVYANKWVTQFPYVGDTHWSLRHPIVLPLALSRLLFGDTLTALLVPTVLYDLGLIAIAGFWVGRSAGPRAALFALILLVTFPLFVLLSSTPNIDTAEAFYVVAGMATLSAAMGRGGAIGWLLGSGVLFGLALLCRETAAFAALAVGVLFLFGFGMPRWRYFVVGLGALLPVALETTLLWLATGDALHRLHIAASHDLTINRWMSQGAGIPLVHPLIDPLLLLVMQHSFGVTFVVGVPLALWLLRRTRSEAALRRLVVLAGTTALCWSFAASALWKQLNLIARYYLTAGLMTSLIAGAALAWLWQRGRRGLAVVLCVAMVGANLLGLAMDNRTYMWGEHALVSLAARTPEMIYTSEQSLRRADVMLQWEGVRGRVSDAAPGPGALFYYDPTRAEGEVQPGPGWTKVEELAPAENPGQRLLQALRLRDRVPASIWRVIGPGHPAVTVYRVG